MPDTENGKVTLAVLRNDLIHLTAMLTTSCANWASWRSEQEKENKDAAADRARLRAELSVIKWAFGAISTVVLALAAAIVKDAFGL